LGLLVLVSQQRFKIPLDKLEYILAVLEGILQGQATKRGVARLAGILLSVAPAVYMAPLYTRRLYLAMGMEAQWDEVLPGEGQALTREDLLFWKHERSQHQGKTWKRRARVYHCCGDVSDTGFAGYSPQLLPQPLVMSYDRGEFAALKNGELSSVYRETKNAALVIKACIRANPGTVHGGLIVYTGDNTGSAACLTKMMGKGRTLDEVRELYREANAANVHLEFIWKPRTSSEMVLADDLSRVVDVSDFALRYGVFKQICLTRHANSGKIWNFPTGDAFAGAHKDFHKADRYFTWHSAPGVLADALVRDWNSLGSPAAGRALVWAFPPFHLLGESIRKIMDSKLDTILVTPAWYGPWESLLSLLPIQDKIDVPYKPGMYLLGSRLPPIMHTSPPRYSLKAYLIVYGTDKHIPAQ
jgi:hypothetical protein